LHPALVQAELDVVTCVPEPEPAYIQKPGADPISVPSALKVQLRDSARYCFVDSPSEVAFPNLNLLHKNTVAARGLLGAAIGQKRHVAMPMGKRRIRVLDVLKAQPSTSTVACTAQSSNGSLIDAPMTNESSWVCHP